MKTHFVYHQLICILKDTHYNVYVVFLYVAAKVVINFVCDHVAGTDDGVADTFDVVVDVITLYYASATTTSSAAVVIDIQTTHRLMAYFFTCLFILTGVFSVIN